MLEVLRSVFRQNVAEVLCVMDPLTLAIMVQSVLCCIFPSRGSMTEQQGGGELLQTAVLLDCSLWSVADNSEIMKAPLQDRVCVLNKRYSCRVTSSLSLA